MSRSFVVRIAEMDVDRDDATMRCSIYVKLIADVMESLSRAAEQRTW